MTDIKAPTKCKDSSKRQVNTAKSSSTLWPQNLQTPPRRLQAHPKPLDSTTQSSPKMFQTEPEDKTPLKNWMEFNFGDDNISGWKFDTLPCQHLRMGDFDYTSLRSNFTHG
jgi:hypothetical protein